MFLLLSHAATAELDAKGRYHHPETGRFCTKEDYEAAVSTKTGEREVKFEPKDVVPAAGHAGVTPHHTMADVTRIKLPAWQAEEPAFWFELADAQFALYTSPEPTEKQKVALAATIIPISILKSHREAMTDPTSPYTKLKTSITGAKVKSDIDLCTELLQAKLAPEEPPSDYLRRFLSTFAEVKGDDGKAMTTATQVKGWLAKHMLERQLPPVVASAMVSDRLDAAKPQTYMDKVDLQHKAYQANQSAHAALVAAVDDVNAVAAKHSRPGKKRNEDKKGGVGGKDGKCFYHTRWGKEAQRCEGECTEKGKPLAKKSD